MCFTRDLQWSRADLSRTHRSARVAVTLANEGEDAFQNHIYGKEITVERTLNKAGGGAYKIKNAEGKVVDTKKATLDQIRECLSSVRAGDRARADRVCRPPQSIPSISKSTTR